MKTASMVMVVFAVLLAACADKSTDNHSHEHEKGEIEPLAFTVYSDKTELFVEFKPLVVGSQSNFAAHFTILGEQFLPLTQGKVTVSLIVGENGIRNSANSASSPGIFRLALIPKTAGKGKLVFDIETGTYSDQLIIDNINVYKDEASALADQTENVESDEIKYLKEQAWKVDFANAPAVKETFFEIIKTNGQILPAPGDEIMITAGASGIVHFKGNKAMIGSKVAQNTPLFTISGGNLTANNLDANYTEAKANYEKNKAEFKRAEELIKDKIISESAFLQAKNAFENAQNSYNTIAKNYSSNGQTIASPINGFVKNIQVSEGQFVETGTLLAVISKNRKLILQANVSQKYFNKLASITSASFKTVGDEQNCDTKMLNGKVISYGKSTNINSSFLPITFEIDNTGNLISGSVAEVYLKSTPIPKALVIPVSALMEELGIFYVYVQLGGESFQKREIKIRASDGEKVEVLSGIKEGERIVTKGAYQIKLSAASGKLPAHGHEH
ncbi:MAG: efflux RND transporter periplasmic adaptor subunit [Saprospiraceae bacterium]|jgi:cobalt-zinc-cadmium efflux system membrane fusion protein|nr:efflux RND transporter periplasmic adaptor subunit [Saprospiraceae bacterium]